MSSKSIPLIILFTAAIIGVNAHPRVKITLPLKEIDRPLILQKGLWQAGCNLELVDILNYSDRSIHRGQLQPGVSNLGRLLPRHALSRRVELPGFPLPYLRALITEGDIGDDSGRVRRAIIFEGGLSGFEIVPNYYSSNGFFLEGGLPILQVATALKWLFTDNLWSEARLGVYSEISSGSVTFYLNGTFGMQLTGQVAATMTLHGWTETPISYSRDNGEVYKTYAGGSGTIKFPIHICRYLTLQPGITVNGNYYQSSWSPYQKYTEDGHVISDPRPPTETKEYYATSKIFLGIVWQYGASGVLFRKSME